MRKYSRSELDDRAVARRLPMVTVSDSDDNPSVLHMPSPRAAVLHAIPVIFEAIVAPVLIFYLSLVATNFSGALIAAFAWSSAALLRRVIRRDRISTVLALGIGLLALRTAVSFITHSATLYFLPPMAWSTIVAFVLIASAIVGRPFTQRFAHDFCPLDPALLLRPRVRQFFVRVSWLWAAVLLTNTGLVLWLLLSSSLKAFVLERTAITWGSTALAIAASIWGFTHTMHRDGITVQWGRPAP